MDLLILSFLGFSNFLLGDYVVALKINLLFFLMPQLFQKYLTNITQRLKESSILDIYGVLFKYFFIFSLLQLFFFIFFGKFLLKYLFNTQNLQYTYQIALLILLGVTLLNTFRPFISFTMAKLPIKKYFYFCILPMSLFSLSVYFTLTYYYGTYGTAFGNILAYGVYGIMVYSYVRFSRYKFQISWFSFSPQEKKLWKLISSEGMFFNSAVFRRKIPEKDK